MLESTLKNLVSPRLSEAAEKNYDSNNRNLWLSDIDGKRDVPNASERLRSVLNVEL
jgi:hypothetical protein